MKPPDSLEHRIEVGAYNALGRPIDAISFILINPCGLSLSIYLETMIKPALNLVLQLVMIDATDMVRGSFRPKNLRSGGCSGRRKKKNGKFKGIPELGEMIGENLHSGDDAKKPNFSKGKKAIWILDAAAQRVLFYVMIYDLATDFIYNWALGLAEIAQQQGCPIGWAKMSGAASQPPVPFGWKWIDFTSQREHRGTGELVTGAARVKLFKAFVYCGIYFKNTGGTTGNILVGLSKNGNHTDWIDGPELLTVAPGQTVQWMGSGQIEAGTWATPEAEMYGAHIWAQNGTLSVQSYAHDPI